MAEPLTLDGELDRQLKLVRRKESDTVVCPWHGTILNSESGDCCIEMKEAKDRLAREHIQKIQRQVRGFRNGLQGASIQCPYCGEINRPENLQSSAHWKREGVSPYCCDLFFAAVTRLAEHAAVQGHIDHARRIQDGIAKVSRN